MIVQRQRGSKLVFLVVLTIVCTFSGNVMSENKLIVKNSSNEDAFVVTDSGAVGLGTTAPFGVIHALGGSYAATQFVSQWIGTTNNGGGGFLGFHNNASGTLPRSGDRLGYFLFGSYDGTTRIIGSGMTVKAEKDWTSTSAPTYLSFDTAPENSTSRAERIRIASNGYVGIGQIAPTQRLEVNGGIRLNTGATKPTCDANSRGTIWFKKGLGTGVADTFEVCVKQSDENYIWRTLF